MKNILIPPGPILSLTLIGVLVLSGLLYYKSNKIQRFLEPALAISQPRNELALIINDLLIKEFGSSRVKGIRYSMGTIYMDESLIFDSSYRINYSGAHLLKKMSALLVGLLRNEHIRSHIDLIFVMSKSPFSPEPELMQKMRLMQYRSELVLSTMFRLSPELEREFGTYLAASYLPVTTAETIGPEEIQFSIVPSEQLHIEVLQRLKKYIH